MDIVAKLNERVAAVRAEAARPEPAPEPAPAAAPETSASETAAAPSVPDAPTPGNPPEVVKTDQATPEGSTPPVQQPQSDAPTTSAVETLAKRGYKVEDEKLAAEYLRLETEFAAMKRAEKAASKAQPAGEPQPDPQQPAKPEPTAAQPAVQPAPRTPEPPATGDVELSAEEEQRIAQLVAADSECVALVNEYAQVVSEQKQLAEIDPRTGRATSGRIVEIASQIAELERVLKPTDRLKALGVELPALDDITRENLSHKLLALKLERHDLNERFRQLDGELSRISDQFKGRRNRHRSEFENRAREARAQAELTAEIDRRTDRFERAWTSGLTNAFKSYSVPDNLRDEIARDLRTAALALPEVLTTEEIPDFMTRFLEKEAKKLDGYHRWKSAEYAKGKEDAVRAATQAPSGAAAIAPPATTHGDLVERLQAKVLAARARAR